ncbi:MATE family multidrug resistance protein [Labrys wisconsinensis]|uniref:Multidrug-efflux transporter n=2 Tax=Labrys wisconsinensis TaxID=425677 RepID=A0ABU0JF52_9HYPH|nr:MATE family multidrug resistance protein [Labrys wisconsinensis]
MTDMAEPRAEGGAWRREIAATFALGWPMILTTLIEVALTTTNIMLLGRLGPQALAAGTLATNLYFAFMIFGVGLVAAVSPMVASEVGRMRHSVRDVRRTVRQGLWTAGVVSVPALIALSLTDPILLRLGQEPAAAHEAARYMHALQWSLPPFLGYIVLRSFVAALGRPRPAVWAGVVAIAVNALLAWALIFGRLGAPGLGIVGAGIATTIATWAMFGTLALVIALDGRLRRYHAFGRFWQADWPRFRELWSLGLPIGITLTFEVSVFNAAAFLMGLIGEASLAAHAIAIQISSVSFMVPLGLAQAATVRVGLAHGAGDREGARRSGWTAYAMGVGFMGCAAATMLLAPRLLIGLFVDLADPANAEVITLATLFLAFAGMFQIVDGAQVLGAGMLRGLHDTRVPMLFAAIGYWGIALPLAVVLAFVFDLGGKGIWIGLASGLAAVAVLMTLRWIRRERLGLVPAA